HLFVLQETGHSIGIGESRLLTKHLATGLYRLSQGDHGTACLGQRFAYLLLQRRLPRAGDAADDYHPVAGAEHMPHRRLLPLVEPLARARPIRVTKRPEPTTPLPGKLDEARFERQHSFVVATGRPAASLRIRGRLAISVATPSTV